MENRSTGFAASGGLVGTFLLVMMLGRLPGPQPAPQQSGPQLAPQPAPAPATGGARPSPFADTTRLLSGDRLLREFLGDTAALNESLAGKRTHQSYIYSLDALIATVPDPVDSRLDWAFDSYVASIRRAYERTGFVIDRFWMPWGSVPDTLRLEGGPRVREVYPGVFLFRRQTGRLVELSLVYLVGEVPTRGVHKLALERALEERERLLRTWAEAAAPAGGRVKVPAERGRVKIVGPSFSGSSLSLRSVLDGWTGADSTAVRIVTGAATNCENRALLQDTATHMTLDSKGVTRVLPRGGPAGAATGKALPRIEFHATVHSDEEFLRALERRVFDSLDIRPERVAILQESSTAYGQNAFGADTLSRGRPVPPGHRWTVCGALVRDSVLEDRGQYLVIPFPMNISRLRAEYARRPVTQGGAAAGQAGAAPVVPVDMSDPARPMESPPVLSALTVPALENAVREISSALIRRRVQAAVILASDVRDKLFLATELRRRVRDVQVFTFEGNALYLAPDFNNDLRGMVVVSTYPLFLRNQWWTAREEDRERIVFGNEGAQGVYNAVLLQLGADSLMAEYVPPVWEDSAAVAAPRSPPVWITAVGAGSFVPVAVDTPDPGGTYAAAAQVRPPRRVDDPRISFFVCLAAVLLSGALLELVRRAVADAFPVLRSRLAAPTVHGTAQKVRCTSLHIHRHLYRMLLLIAVTAMWIPVARFYSLSAVAAGQDGQWAVEAARAVLLFLAFLGIGVQAAAALVLMGTYWPVGVAFALGPHWGTTGRRVVWLVEVAARVVVVLLGMVFLALAATYAAEVGGVSGPALRLYLHRVARVDVGVTPLLPLLLGGAGLALWCTWHLRRIRRLSEVTMFESACLSHWDRSANEKIEAWYRQLDPRNGRVLGALVRRWLARGARRGPPGERPVPVEPLLLSRDIVKHVYEVRNRLFLMVPDLRGLLLLGVVLVGALLLFLRIRHTLEHAAGTPGFDRILRFAIVGALVSTVWAVYRLLAIWKALRRVLEDVGTTPLLTAFDRLPREVSRLTRLTLVGAPACEIVSSVRAAQWRQLRGIPPPAEGGPGGAEAEELEQELWREVRSLPTELQRGRATCDRYHAEGACFARLDSLLGRLWGTEPSRQQVAKVREAVGLLSLWKDDEARPDTGLMFRRSVPGVARFWLRAAEEFAAVQVVDYVEWVLQHMRTLTWFLFLSLLLTTALLSSYPYEPQRVAKLVFFCVLVVTVGALVYVMTDMNRDEVLSRIAKTDPGRITWDRGYLLNVAVIAVIPMLTLISSEVPWLRDVLFSWIEPLLRALAR